MVWGQDIMQVNVVVIVICDEVECCGSIEFYNLSLDFDGIDIFGIFFDVWLLDIWQLFEMFNFIIGVSWFFFCLVIGFYLRGKM